MVDPKGYLTNLNSIRVSSDAEVGDIKKARTLLSSVTSTNPKHGPGWIAAARVEEFAGKLVQARKIIRQGCEACPEAEDVWLEASSLHPTDSAKTVLANAVKHLPQSVKIWLQAAELETNLQQKKVVLRRALEFVPNSVKLWKTAIELESAADARILLARAVECVPHSVDMWLALTRLETHENARKVLNQAREAIPTEPLTWITAAKLEEAHGNGELVGRIIEKMLASLAQFEVLINREQWLREAEAAEQAGATLTCRAIVKNTVHLGVEDEDRKATWMDDAESFLAHSPPAVETARAIYGHALQLFPNKKSLWLSAATLEKAHGTADTLESMLKEAVKNCPRAEILWLMAAKEKWLQGLVAQARAVLIEAFEANPESEQVWLAAVKLEWENNELERARILLAKARDRASSPRVWLKSALLEREAGDEVQTLQLLDAAVARYPTFPKFYMMAGQVCEACEAARAREYYQRGLQQCPESVPLWRLAVRLEEATRGPAKARSLLDLAQLRLPRNDAVWLEAIRLERRAGGGEKAAEVLMAKALKDCPDSGLLWAEELLTCPKTAQKQKSVDALKRCDSSPPVILAVARLFQRDRKTAKARKWFERAAALSPRCGDAWAFLYALELQAGAAAAELETICGRCAQAAPNSGEIWCRVAKQTELRRADAATVLKRCVEQILRGEQGAEPAGRIAKAAADEHPL